MKINIGNCGLDVKAFLTTIWKQKRNMTLARIKRRTITILCGKTKGTGDNHAYYLSSQCDKPNSQAANTLEQT